MNELINFNIQAEGERITISARDLHEALQIKTQFKDWFPRMCAYGFEEGTDFNPLKNERVQMEGGRQVTREVTDYEITIEMAKQICMLQRSDLGKQYRQYFIQLEKDWNSPEKVMSRALDIAHKEIASLGKQIDVMKPKAIFADAVSVADTSILVGQLAKIIKQNGYDIGQNRLFQWMRDHEYLGKAGNNRNLPTQKSMDLGLFEIKESTVQNPDGSVRITRTPKVTGRGQVYFINKFCGEKKEGADHD